MVEEKEYKKKSNRRRDTQPSIELDREVLGILDQVRTRGDAALREFTKSFDGVELDRFTVTEEEWEEALALVTDLEYASLSIAKQNIERFHKEQVEHSWFIEPSKGVLLGQQLTPIERVGIYIPGGKAAYPSTVLMNAVPAKIAGVQKLSMVTPPGRDGKVNPYVLAAARLAGVDVVYKVGGAQAIAALAYGTETINKVYKITGPGNSYVARAKKWVFGDVAIDMIAGPSEICVWADESANPTFVASDLLSQAEHDERAVAFCITTSRTFAKRLSEEVCSQLAGLERKDIAEQSIYANGEIIIAESASSAIDMINELAPEHLQIMVDKPMEQLPLIRNAGAIFIGSHSPEALGDYIAGPNHTLPTNGTSAFSSPLGVYDFMKRSSVIQYTAEALSAMSDHIIRLAEMEQLTAHANSIRVRKDELYAN